MKKYTVVHDGCRFVADGSFLKEHPSCKVVDTAADDSTVAQNVRDWQQKAAERRVEMQGFNPINLYWPTL